MSRVVHFEISAKDPQKVIPFYENVLGWAFHKWEGPMEYWLVHTGDASQPGIDGGLSRPSDQLSGTVNTVDVDNLDEALAKVGQNGGKVIADKHAVPGVGWLAYCQDPEGTVFGMMQDDPKAGM